jgi:hypothetical protein
MCYKKTFLCLLLLNGYVLSSVLGSTMDKRTQLLRASNTKSLVLTSVELGGPEAEVIDKTVPLVAGNCPMGCSGKGKCIDNKCLCETGFVGAGCQSKHFQGYALAFLDEGYVELPPLGNSNSFTIECWIRMFRTPQMKGTAMSLFSTDDQKVSLVVTSEGHLKFSVKNNMPESVVFDKSSSSLKPLKWYHVAVAYSMRHAGRTGTGSATMYLNGQWIQTLGYAARQGSTNKVTCGAAKIGQHFHGILDEFRFFSRALTPAEVSHHAAGRITGTENGLLASYRFDEGFGNKVIDHAANQLLPSRVSHDGTIVGTTSYVLSYAPFEVCNLRCSDHGVCLVVNSSHGFDQHVCKCDQGYDGKECEKQVCPGTPKPCNAPNGYCQRTIMQNTPHWKAPALPKLFLEHGMLTKDELSRYKGTTRNYTLNSGTFENVKSAVEKALDIVKRAEWDAAHEKAWKCVCKGLWSGDACERKKCPSDCMDHGHCTNKGECVCSEGWRGTMCSEAVCPNDCSGNGDCVNGTCVCNAGFTGQDCAILNQCPKGCSGHGRCTMGECQCDPAYTGDDCSWAASCYNFCSGRGKCINDECACDKLYTGVDCSEPRCPNDCGGKGDCLRGICMCEPGFEGPACETDIIWPMRCSTQRLAFSSSSSCKRGIEALEVVPEGARVLQVKYDGESRISGAYQVYGP